MTLAEQLKQEGWKEGWLIGLQEAKFEVAKCLLDADSDPAFISKVTGLSLAQIKAL